MKLRNKKTGVIVDLVKGYIKDSYYGQKIEIKPLAISNKEGYMYNSLAELNEDWEDYEGPKQWYGLNAIRDVGFEPLEYEGFEDLYKHAKELGIAFETKEEAERAVLKLKAWKRLRDRGFIFSEWEEGTKDYKVVITGILPKGLLDNEQDSEDLDLLFDGGEND